MTAPSTLRLHLDEGRPLTVQVHRTAAIRSVHTGRDIRELHGWVVTSDEQVHQRLAALLPSVADRSLRSEDQNGDYTGRWCVSWNSYGEAAGVHTYTLILREAEELSLRALFIDGTELHPYEYREEALPGGLRVRAKIVGSEAEVLRLRELAATRDAFAVVRSGIQDEPRSMRLSVQEWSPFEDRVKYRLVLVDIGLERAVDDPMEEGQIESSRAALVFYANYLERLAELLVDKNVLSREELQRLRDTARLEPGVSRHELWRVTDVDQA